MLYFSIFKCHWSHHLHCCHVLARPPNE